MSLKKKALSGMLWTSVQTFGTQFVSFAVSIVLARVLLPEEFGLMGMISIFLAIASVLINGGLATSIIRTDLPDDEDYCTVFTYNFFVSILSYAVMFVAAPYIASFFAQPALTHITRLMSLIFILNAFSTMQVTRFHKELNFKAETKASAVSVLLSAGVGIGLAVSGYGVMSLVYSGLAAAASNSVMIWLLSSWKPRLLFNREKFRKHFSFGNRMLLSGLLDTLYTNAYVLLIGKFFPAAQLGYYNRADSLKQLPVSNFTSVLNKVTFPLFAEIKNDDERLKRVFKEIMQMVIFIIAPVLILMAVLAEPLFLFLFTEKWLPAVPYFQILCITGILYPLHSYNLNILTVKGRSDLFLKLEIFKKLLLTVIIVVSLFYGIYGLLWGQVLFSVLAYFINTSYSGIIIKYPVWEQLKDIAPVLILALIAGLVAGGSDMLLQTMEKGLVVRIVLATLAGGTVFIILAKVFRFTSFRVMQELLLRNSKSFVSLRFNLVDRFLKK